jgi:hypothetical protein
MSSMKDQRFLGFKKEICVKDGSSWSDQTFTVRAKFEVRTLTGLEDLIYEVNLTESVVHDILCFRTTANVT